MQYRPYQLGNYTHQGQLSTGDSCTKLRILGTELVTGMEISSLTTEKGWILQRAKDIYISFSVVEKKNSTEICQ